MKRGLAIVAVGFSLAGAAAVAAQTPATRGVDGSWIGVLKVTPQIELRITLDLTKAKDGSLTGKWGSPDESVSGLPLGFISLVNGELAFTTRNGVTYKGKPDAAGAEIVGN